MMSDWKKLDDAAEVKAELERDGYAPGDAFYVARFDDGRIAALFPDDGACSRPWGPERYYA